MTRAEKVETEIRREQIAQAAMDIVAIHGFKGLTNERVASMIGIVPSALYKHFKNKSQIIDAIVELMVTRMRELIQNARKIGDNPLDCLRRVYLAHLYLVVQSPAIPMIIFSEEGAGPKGERKAKFQAIGKLLSEELSKLFQIAIDKKLIRHDLKAESLTMFYVGMIAQAGFIMEHHKDKELVFEHGDLAWKTFVEILHLR
ncbi:MAG: TetR/AcrR family transcriptional regulator [Candidatus Ozemobacteraceae bacterium]